MKEANEVDNAADLTGVENSADIGESTSVNAQVSLNQSPEINFSEETSMEWPVNGHVLIDYSMDQSVYFPTLDQYKLSPAISVQAVEGTVVSAVNGTVYSIENDAETGTTVTMELGNGYQAIYGQLTDLDVAEGDSVEKGDKIIGYVAAPTKYYSEEGSNRTSG